MMPLSLKFTLQLVDKSCAEMLVQHEAEALAITHKISEKGTNTSLQVRHKYDKWLECQTYDLNQLRPFFFSLFHPLIFTQCHKMSWLLLLSL